MAFKPRTKRGARIRVSPKGQRTYRGVLYPSQLEALRAELLDELVKVDALDFWIGQPLFRLGCPENRYRADFLCVGKDGEVWVEDVKGHMTDSFKRHVRLWKIYGPCDLFIVRRRSPGWHSELIEGRNSEQPPAGS